MELYDHQKEALQLTKNRNRVAFFHDMGLGKTFTGSEKMMELGEKNNLIICQKSKIDDWYYHIEDNYKVMVYDLTDSKCLEEFLSYGGKKVGVINYDLVFKRPQILKLKEFTLLLDESSLIKNRQSKRSKFIMKMNPKNIILLSGTPMGGKYEELWSQMKLLGWNIDYKMFFNHYVDYHYEDDEGFPILIVDGYKNVERLKRKMREYGCHFLKTEEVFDLPKQTFQVIRVDSTKEYRKFKKTGIVNIEEVIPPSNDFIVHQLVGDSTFSKMLYERQLCGQFNKDKLEAFRDIVESTEDRIIVFYNFNGELEKLIDIAIDENRPYSTINGTVKDLKCYENDSNAITFIQYQAGAMGLNLQKANKIIYFTPPLSSELFEQSKKRIHRIGQDRPCFYYKLVCRYSIEEKIYSTLKSRKDYTEALFEYEEKN